MRACRQVRARLIARGVAPAELRDEVLGVGARAQQRGLLAVQHELGEAQRGERLQSLERRAEHLRQPLHQRPEELLLVAALGGGRGRQPREGEGCVEDVGQGSLLEGRGLDEHGAHKDGQERDRQSRCGQDGGADDLQGTSPPSLFRAAELTLDGGLEGGV